MTYYLVTDAGTQWFHYLISKDGDKVVDAHDMKDLNGVKSTLLSNIYTREPIPGPFLVLYHSSLVHNGGHYGGWTISKLEYDRIRRLLELSVAVKEFEKIKDSV